MKQQDRTLRIIGGKWRGRKVTFSSSPAIRPTPDRIRETLFNWLMQDTPGARCLDLFAGSGALSLEALSRGAERVTLVDKNRSTLNQVRQNLETLQADTGSYTLITEDVMTWLADCQDEFDVIFVDPPFADEMHYRICDEIESRQLAAGYIYVESAQELEHGRLPAGWDIHRQKRAGGVHYALCRRG